MITKGFTKGNAKAIRRFYGLMASVSDVQVSTRALRRMPKVVERLSQR